MAHHHSDQHGGGGHGSPEDFGRAFAIGIALNLVYVMLEAAFGLYSGSLALLADAGHNLSDVLGLVLAWGAVWLGKRPPWGRQTFGFKRSSILASLSNAILLMLAVGAITYEAIRRLLEPEQVASSTVIWVAVVGLFVNGFRRHGVHCKHGRASQKGPGSHENDRGDQEADGRIKPEPASPADKQSGKDDADGHAGVGGHM